MAKKKETIRIIFWRCFYCDSDNISESFDVRQGGIVKCELCETLFCTQKGEG